MSLGWFSGLPEADLYFTDERLETNSWDLLTNAQKTKAVVNAYNRIYYSGLYNVPTYLAATAAQLQILKRANGEMAYYLAIHLADEDRRKGIQVQGTIQAGIVQESYDSNWLQKLPIPPFVNALLKAFIKVKALKIVDLERDENYDVLDQTPYEGIQ